MECDGLPSLLQDECREHLKPFFVPVTFEPRIAGASPTKYDLIGGCNEIFFKVPL